MPYPSEFSIYASVSKVRLPDKSNNNTGNISLFVMDPTFGTSGSAQCPHQGHQLREITKDKWITIPVSNASLLKKINEGDFLSFSVAVSNNSDNSLSIPESRFAGNIKDFKVNMISDFINYNVANKKTGDEAARKIFGVFGDETFHYAFKDKETFIAKSREMGVPISGVVRFLSNAERYTKEFESFKLLRQVNVDPASTVMLVNQFGENLLNHIENSPWFLSSLPIMGIKYKPDGNTIRSIKPKIDAMDSLYKIVHGVAAFESASERRAYWIYNMLVNENHQFGHTAVRRQDLIEQACDKHFFDYDDAELLMDKVIQYGKLVQSQTIHDDLLISDLSDYYTEQKILEDIQERMNSSNTEVSESDLEFEDFFSPEQTSAITKAVANKLCVITGGAGTGKTTVIKSVMLNAKSFHNISQADILLLAPTGKAADRLKESTGIEASTVSKIITKMSHQFPDGNGKVSQKYVIVDEAGMLDSQILYDLLKLIDKDTHIVLVGDYKQLAPVKHGQPFKDMLVSGFVSSQKLSKPQRTSTSSEIHHLATYVSEGMFPQMSNYKDEVTFFESNRDDNTRNQLLKVLEQDFADKYSTSFDDTVILTPMNNGPLGVQALNKVLKPIMNPDAEGEGVYVTFGKSKKAGPYHVGDRIIVKKNNYKKGDGGIFNGDVGSITKIGDKGEFHISLRGQDVILYGRERLNIDLAYALTVHKTQGSEYNTVIQIASDSHKRMLSPELFYTGVTRAKQNLILIGSTDAIEHACDPANSQIRTTYLQAKLELMAKEKGLDIPMAATKKVRKAPSPADFISSAPKTVEREFPTSVDMRDNEAGYDMSDIDAYNQMSMPDGGEGPPSFHDEIPPYDPHDDAGLSEPPPAPNDDYSVSSGERVPESGVGVKPDEPVEKPDNKPKKKEAPSEWGNVSDFSF